MSYKTSGANPMHESLQTYIIKRQPNNYTADLSFFKIYILLLIQVGNVTYWAATVY